MYNNEDAFNVAQTFIGTEEIGGGMDNPMVLAMLRLDNQWPQNDEVPWCSAFVNFVCKLLKLPRSKSLMARSWLEVGRGIRFDQVETGDIVVFMSGDGEQPGPEVTNAPGHVGFFAGEEGAFIEVLGGNQSNTVKVSRYRKSKLLSVRRLT